MEKAQKVPKKEEISAAVSRDLGIVVSFINIVRNNPDIQNSLVDVIYERLKAEHEAKISQPEKFENGQ